MENSVIQQLIRSAFNGYLNQLIFKMENINILKKKLKSAKSSYSKFQSLVQENTNSFTKTKDKEPDNKKRQIRVAEDALENMTTMKEKLKNVRFLSDTLIDAIDEHGTGLDKDDEIVEQIQKDVEEYEMKMREFMERNNDVISNIETISEETTATPLLQRDNTGWKTFKPNQALKPPFLEKEASYLATTHFSECFRFYIMDGYQGNPKGCPVYIQLQSLVEATWWTSLCKRGVNQNKDLEQILEIIEIESDARNPIHNRRMNLMRIKKTGSHSDFLISLEEIGNLIDMKSLTLEALIMHLFMEQSDQTMAKTCQEILAKEPNGNLALLRQEIQRTESSVWYEGTNNRVRVAGVRYCSDCDSPTHNKDQCWGECTVCKKRGHRSENCKYKDTNTSKRAKDEEEKLKLESIAAKKAAKNKKMNEKKKEKRKALKEAKKATENPPPSPASSSTDSEAESPIKATSARLARVGMDKSKRALFRLEEELEMMSSDEHAEFGDSVFKALKVKKAGSQNSPLFRATVYPNRESTRGQEEEFCADTGCTKPIVGAIVCKEQNIHIKPLDRTLVIRDASGNALNIIGTAVFYIASHQVLGNRRRRVQAAVLEGNDSDREILISLDLLIQWDLVHPNFPNETLSQYFLKMNKNKNTTKKPHYYANKATTAIYEREGLSHNLRDPTHLCMKLKEKIITKYKNNFKERLGPLDRMRVEPVNLEIDESRNITPVKHIRPFDVPYHLRKPWEEEIKNALEGKILVPVSTPTDWSSKAFAVPKQDSTKVRIVADFRQLNRALKRPHWPTESSGQLLRHISPKARYFVTIDATSGYHQIPVSKESQKYLTIITQQGKFAYTVTPQGVCSSSDLFNLLTDGNVRFDGTNTLKNMDDWLIYGSDLDELEKKLTNLMDFCQEKNLKLNPSKLVISEEVEFGGSIISAETIQKEEVIFIDPKNKRIKAFSELKKPTTKKECQVFCGMLASLQQWFPSLPLHIPCLRKATAGANKFSWTEILEEEYETVKEVVKTQIRLTPYDPEKKLRLIIDGASSVGVGFVLFQYLSDENPEKGAVIINANSSLLGENQLGYSPIDAEMIGLDFAARACHYWLWACPEIELYSDCSGMLDMMNKPIADITNRRHQKVLARIMQYNFNCNHIAGVDNKIADALSRLCRDVMTTHHYANNMPRILPMSKRASTYIKQLEVLDPMVVELAQIGAADQEYVDMLNTVENGVSTKHLPAGSELKMVEGSIAHLGVVTMPDGNRLLVKDGGEVFVPKSERKRILETIHMDHMCDQVMIKQAKSRIYWPRMRQEIKEIYQTCQPCTEFRNSKPQKPNEISQRDVFSNFFPNEQIEVDFASKGSRDFLLIVDSLTGFGQVFETRNKGSAEAALKIREWSALFGKPYRCKSDYGPGFRESLGKELKSLGIEMVHSSAYNPSSNAAVERRVRTLKELLNKCGPLTQLQLREMIFCSNSREQEGGQGSPMGRFLGHGIRTGLPNSVDRNMDWNHLMDIRAAAHQKRVDKPGKTTKDEFKIGENVWVQNVRTRKWDKQGTISAVRVAYDGKIVSYDLELNGHAAIRHRRYLRKVYPMRDAESGQSEGERSSQGPERPNRQAGPYQAERETGPVEPRRSSRNAARQQL